MFPYIVSQKYYKSQPQIKNPHDFTLEHSMKQAIIAYQAKKKQM